MLKKNAVFMRLVAFRKRLFIYYEEGGVTPDYVQLPDGYALEEGMESILFLNKEGYCWGAGSIFPVVGNKIILNETARNYFDEKDVSVWDTPDLRRKAADSLQICVHPPEALRKW